MKQRFSGISFSGITLWHYLPEGLVLPYAHNSISFDVNAIEIRPEPDGQLPYFRRV